MSVLFLSNHIFFRICILNPIRKEEQFIKLYRHDITKHGDVFMAIVAITELIIENGEPLMDVEYEDPYLDDHYYPENLEAAVADEDDNSSVGGSSSDEETIDRS